MLGFIGARRYKRLYLGSSFHVHFLETILVLRECSVMFRFPCYIRRKLDSSVLRRGRRELEGVRNGMMSVKACREPIDSNSRSLYPEG